MLINNLHPIFFIVFIKLLKIELSERRRFYLCKVRNQTEGIEQVEIISALQINPNYSVLDTCLLFFLRDLRMNLPITKRMMATTCPAK
jgi:hypothetical protein